MVAEGRTAVVIPTYNEAENLPALVGRLLALDPPVDIVIVDDQSPDGTGEIADDLARITERIHVIHRTVKRGYAGACREGLDWCLDQGVEYIVTMDADLSHDPQRVTGLVGAVAGGADLAIGSRYVEGGGLEVDWGPFRTAVSKLGSAYARAMIGTRVRDCTSGFRCYRASALIAAHVDDTLSEGYCFLIEVLGRATQLGWKIVEVPICYHDRDAGASKISRSVILEALVLSTKLGVSRVLRRRTPAETSLR